MAIVSFLKKASWSSVKWCDIGLTVSMVNSIDYDSLARILFVLKRSGIRQVPPSIKSRSIQNASLISLTLCSSAYFLAEENVHITNSLPSNLCSNNKPGNIQNKQPSDRRRTILRNIIRYCLVKIQEQKYSISQIWPI